MGSLNRYILRQLVMGTVLVAIGMTGVVWLTQSLRFTELIVDKGLSIKGFLYLTVLLTPNFLAIILPFAVFTTVTFFYSKMISDRELIVMRAIGMSQTMISMPALLLALIAVMLSYSLNFYFFPKSYQKFRELQLEFRDSYSQILLREGSFNAITDDITIYMHEYTSNNQIKDILYHDTREPKKPVTMMAKQGSLVMTEETPKIIMLNGTRQTFDRKTHKFSILYFDRYAVNIDIGSNKSITHYRKSQERMVHELLNIEQDKTIRPEEYGHFRVAGHKRLILPLHIFVFTLVSLVCLISGSIARHLRIKRIVLVVALVIILQAMYMGLEYIAVKRQFLIPFMYITAIVPIFLIYSILSHSLWISRSWKFQFGSSG